jgi:hypothetical protein
LFSLSMMLTPLPCDSPVRPPPAAQLAALRTRADVVNVSVLEDGTKAPPELTLPVLLNRRQTLAFMNANYPKGKLPKPTRDAIAWVFVDRQGHASSAVIAVESGSPRLDSLSIRTFSVAQFAPATVGADTFGVWVAYPARIPDQEEILTALAVMDGVRGERPIKTPFTKPPELLNRTRIEAAVLRVIHSVNSAVNERNEAFLLPAFPEDWRQNAVVVVRGRIGQCGQRARQEIIRERGSR